MVVKLLLIVSIADPQQLNNKCKLVLYIGAFVKLFNWRNYGLVYEIYRIVEVET